MSDTLYDANEIIFSKGDPSEFAYVIKFGKVEILEHYPEAPICLAVLQESDVFGEMGLVDERPRSLTARAITETRVSRISRNDFIELILHKPEQAFLYLRMFFERLRAMNMRIAHDHQGPEKDESGPKEFKVRLTAKTPAAAKVIASDGFQVTRFPFRVGRSATRRGDPMEINDLLLPDESPFNVSRNHFSVEKTNSGIFIHDRGSYLGTIVNGEVIGGDHKEARTLLKRGENEVIVGSENSPYKIQVDVISD